MKTEVFYLMQTSRYNRNTDSFDMLNPIQLFDGPFGSLDRATARRQSVSEFHRKGVIVAKQTIDIEIVELSPAELEGGIWDGLLSKDNNQN